MNQDNISILSAETTERPVYWEFTKNELVGHHPTMANLICDPFPTAKNDEVVRREIIGRELVLHAKLTRPADSLRPGVTLAHNGHQFALKSVKEHIDTTNDESLFEVDGSEMLTPLDPMTVFDPVAQNACREVIAQIGRRAFSDARPVIRRSIVSPNRNREIWLG
jgi:hypothetical protein